jgi:hypothetical protein
VLPHLQTKTGSPETSCGAVCIVTIKIQINTGDKTWGTVNSSTMTVFQVRIHLNAITVYLINVHWYSSNKLNRISVTLQGPNVRWCDYATPLGVVIQIKAVLMIRPCFFYVSFNASWLGVFKTVPLKILVSRYVTPCSPENTKILKEITSFIFWVLYL